MDQSRVWKDSTAAVTVDDIVARYNSPATFQEELAVYLSKLCSSRGYRDVIEAGCETATTSMRLTGELNRHFLDLNDEVLAKVEAACERVGIVGVFISEDMFNMSAPDDSYDLVFNSGVLEHFDQAQRVSILREYARVLRDDGTMVIVVPNHYSFPYRSAYVLKKVLLRGFEWPWPPEYRIRDLRDEANAAGLVLSERRTTAKDWLWKFWGFSPLLRQLLIASDRLFRHEGYLTILVMEKARA